VAEEAWQRLTGCSTGAGHVSGGEHEIDFLVCWSVNDLEAHLENI